MRFTERGGYKCILNKYKIMWPLIAASLHHLIFHIRKVGPNLQQNNNFCRIHRKICENKVGACHGLYVANQQIKVKWNKLFNLWLCTLVLVTCLKLQKHLYFLRFSPPANFPSLLCSSFLQNWVENLGCGLSAMCTLNPWVFRVHIYLPTTSTK